MGRESLQSHLNTSRVKGHIISFTEGYIHVCLCTNDLSLADIHSHTHTYTHTHTHFSLCHNCQIMCLTQSRTFCSSPDAVIVLIANPLWLDPSHQSSITFAAATLPGIWQNEGSSTILKTLQYIHYINHNTLGVPSGSYSISTTQNPCVRVLSCVCAYVCVTSQSPLFHKVLPAF
jgi:hypothetical protein